tara:strand:+ start:1342 stop:1971 length:630 start_codon:yes stop_codon:yes gene_type:complete
MALKIRSLLEGLEFEGRELDYIIDDELDLGEVYLDGTLLFQADDIISEKQLDTMFRYDFVIEDIPEDMLGLEEDKIDYNIDGISTGLFTVGGEFITKNGKEYIGDYHMHPEGGPMIGKFHDASDSSAELNRLSLQEISDNEELLIARQTAPHTHIDYTIDEDVYPHIGSVVDPITLTDDELLAEQRKTANLIRFGIEEDDPKHDDTSKE